MALTALWLCGITVLLPIVCVSARQPQMVDLGLGETWATHPIGYVDNSTGPCHDHDDGEYCVANCTLPGGTLTCATQCPHGQGADEEELICTNCADDTPFTDLWRRSCVAKCPSGSVVHAASRTHGESVMNMSQVSPESRDCKSCISTDDATGAATVFSDHNLNQCVRTCPFGTEPDANNGCISLCPNTEEFFQGMVGSPAYPKCTSHCPPGDVADGNRVCYDECLGKRDEKTGKLAPYALNQAECASRCPPGQAPDDDDDCYSCQEDNDLTPFSFFGDKRSAYKCVGICPPGYVGHDVSFDCIKCGQTIVSVKGDVPWEPIVTVHTMFADHATNQCVLTCPEGSTNQTALNDVHDCKPMCLCESTLKAGTLSDIVTVCKAFDTISKGCIDWKKLDDCPSGQELDANRVCPPSDMAMFGFADFGPLLTSMAQKLKEYLF